MDFQLNEKTRQMVENNYRLVHYIVNKMNYSTDSYDDLVSTGIIGLCKAATTFDETKGLRFATYATKCINNEILMFIRRSKKYLSTVSIDQPMLRLDTTATDNDELTLESFLSDDDDFVENFIEKDYFCERINILLNYLHPLERELILLRLAGLTQYEISSILNFSQSYISRIENKIRKKLCKPISCNKKIYYFEVTNQFYILKFFLESKKNPNKLFSTLLKNFNINDGFLIDFKLQCHEGEIIFSFEKQQRAFYVIAKILKLMDSAFLEDTQK